MRRQIFKDLPNAKHIKFILLVKNPVDRTISDFHHVRVNGWEHNITHKVNDRHSSSATQDTDRGLVFDQMMIRPDGRVNTDTFIIDTSVYSKHFKNWLAAFPRDKFMIIEHDILNKNVSYVLRQIEQFLGLRPFFQEDMFTRGGHGDICFTSPGKSKVCPGLKRVGLPKPKPSTETRAGID